MNLEPTLKFLKWVWNEAKWLWWEGKRGTVRLAKWSWNEGLIGSFVTGLFVILPIFVSVAIIQWLVQTLRDIFGPGTFFGNLFTYSGSAIIGTDSGRVAFWFGVVFAMAIIWFIGVLIKGFAKRKIDNALSTLLSQVPIFRTIYKPVSQILKLLRTDENTEMKGMSVVFCSFGADNGVRMLALQPSQDVYTVEGTPHVIVYIPTSPVPMSGGLIFVRKEAVVPAPEISVDDVMKIYLSLGALGPETMPPQYLEGFEKETGNSAPEKKET